MPSDLPKHQQGVVFVLALHLRDKVCYIEK